MKSNAAGVAVFPVAEGRCDHQPFFLFLPVTVADLVADVLGVVIVHQLGDADGKFGDFKQNGGTIVDVLLKVGNPETGISEVKGENGNVKGVYDLTGRKLEQISAPGVYIVNGKKVLVK